MSYLPHPFLPGEDPLVLNRIISVPGFRARITVDFLMDEDANREAVEGVLQDATATFTQAINRAVPDKKAAEEWRLSMLRMYVPRVESERIDAEYKRRITPRLG